MEAKELWLNCKRKWLQTIQGKSLSQSYQAKSQKEKKITPIPQAFLPHTLSFPSYSSNRKS